MKVAIVDGRVGFVVADRFLDAEDATDGRCSAEPTRLFEQWDHLAREAPVLTVDQSRPEISRLRLERPVPGSPQVFGIGLNYGDHAAEAGMELPKNPMVFPKFTSCLTGPQDELELGSSTVDWEVELVVVIGSPARRVAAVDAWDHVAAVTVGQDISDRVVQFEGGPNPQFGLGKSMPGFGPIGPWLVSTDELDVAPSGQLALEISCDLNGELMQQSNTRHLIFDVPRLISFLSARVQLEAGDLVFTGTPSGIGFSRHPARYLEPGDVLRSTIERIGTLTTKVKLP